LLGYDFSNWTGITAAHHAEVTWGKIISPRTATRALLRQGLSKVRPRPVPALADPEWQQRFFDELRPRLQAAGPDDHYLFLDACTVQRQATLTRLWWVKGEQPQVKMEGFGDRQHVYGVLDPARSEFHFKFAGGVDSREFCLFLDGLRCLYPSGHLFIVLDNAPAHHSQVTLAYVESLGDRIKLLYLPPYSPKLNPIEKFWKYLRQQVTHNTYFATHDEFKFRLLKFLVQHTEPRAELVPFSEIYYRNDPISVLAL